MWCLSLHTSDDRDYNKIMSGKRKRVNGVEAILGVRYPGLSTDDDGGCVGEGTEVVRGDNRKVEDSHRREEK